MSKRIQTRQAICDLFCAGKLPTEVIRDLRVDRDTAYRVKKRMEATPEGEEPNLEVAYCPRARDVLTPCVRAGVKRRIRAAPTKSLRRITKKNGFVGESKSL